MEVFSGSLSHLLIGQDCASGLQVQSEYFPRMQWYMGLLYQPELQTVRGGNPSSFFG